MFYILFAFALLGHTLAKGSIPYCPNNQPPALNEEGKIIQCLPGDEYNCGEGYACAFAGHNYQCCPSFPDDPLMMECPIPLLNVLDEDDNPLRCDNITRSCPGQGMQCMTVNFQLLCCQGISYINGGGKIEEEVDQEARMLPECPHRSYAVLDANLIQLKCDGQNCNRKTQFCHEDAGVSICCEAYLALDEQNVHNEGSDQLAILDGEKAIAQNETATTLTVLNNIPLQVETPHEPNSSDVIESTTSADSYTTTSVNQKINDDNSKSAVNIQSDKHQGSLDDEKVQVKYKPHSFGGYALSKPLALKNEERKESNRDFARRFLLQQIKRGWPYNEDFYRPLEILNTN